MVLSTSSTRILLNGQPGRRICHARGLRQGDPLSPMLFVLIMESLNNCLSWVEQQGFLAPISAIAGYRVSLYADDLVLFVLPQQRDLEVIRGVLSIFGLASGLFSNLDKSVATPLNCTDAQIQLLRDFLPCRVEDLPCRYLGVPLSVRKLTRSQEQPIIDKVAARIPGWKGQMLNVTGRTALVKATLSAITVHTSIAICLSPWAISAIDKLRRAFIWAGTDAVAGGKCKVAWPLVTRPRDLGGLGISDLRQTGIALRVRWIWKDRRLGRAPRTSERSALALFQAATLFILGNGESIFFWTDRWLQGESVQSIAPAVFAAVRPRKRRATVAEALPNLAWVRHICAPITMQLVVEISRLCDLLEHVRLLPQPDTLSWRLTEDLNYSAASAYGAMFLGASLPLGAKEIWRTAAPPRVRFFFWLVLHGRCWTAERRRCHGLQPDDTCIMCDQGVETIDHILLNCCYCRGGVALLAVEAPLMQCGSSPG